MHRTTTTLPRRPRLAAYTALLALALFQLGFAMHQGEHAVAELGENCVACAHYHDSDPALAPATAAECLPSASGFVRLPPAVAADADAFYPSSIRAPPTV